MKFRPVRDTRPLAVQVYDQIYDAVVSTRNVHAPLPTESDLATQLGVSRTTVRQALGLLEEDGVLTRGPARRRHISLNGTHVPGQLAPLEEMFQTTEAITVKILERSVNPATEWMSRLLDVTRGESMVTWGGAVYVGSQLAASTLEIIRKADEPARAPHEGGDEAGPDVRSGTGGEPAGARTMYAHFSAADQAQARITSMRLAPHTTMLRLAQEFRQGVPLTNLILTAALPGGANYLAKHVVDLGLLALDVLPSPPVVSDTHEDSLSGARAQ